LKRYGRISGKCYLYLAPHTHSFAHRRVIYARLFEGSMVLLGEGIKNILLTPKWRAKKQEERMIARKTEEMKKKLKKRAERAGWIAGDTSLSDLSIEELS
jgi:hypothetical protein